MQAAGKARCVNWKQGVGNFGDEGLYRKVLAEYPRTLLRDVEKIQAAHNEGDYTVLFEVALHMRGSSSYVAADRLHAAACALSNALDGAAVVTREALRPFVTSVSQEAQALCSEITGFKGSSKKAQSKAHSDSEDAGLLAEEHAALEEGRSAHGRQKGVADEERPQGKKCTCMIQ
mmetsp:Transcript_138021/g.243867  ORF Transcript_138021/g.243867 Transcript_138021/m.243867 type:complete len:175 (-) Transcript_138021:79-603(-)